MTDSMSEIHGIIEKSAKEFVQSRGIYLLESYLLDRSPHLKYLGLEGFELLIQSDLIKHLEGAVNIQKSGTETFDHYKYSLASTALTVEKKRLNKSMNVTIQDLPEFFMGVTNAAN